MKLATTTLIATLTCGGFAATSVAAATVDYTLTINDPVFNAQNGNFNVPDFRLTNTSDSGVSITDFQLTIGDTALNYDFVRNDSAVTDPGGDLCFTLDSVGRSNDGNGDDVLSYSFLGFDPGDVFQFEVDIDPDGAGGVVQDFRDVLFPLATASITFSDGTILGNTFDPADTSQTSFQFAAEPAPVPLPGGLSLLLATFAASFVILRPRRASGQALLPA